MSTDLRYRLDLSDDFGDNWHSAGRAFLYAIYVQRADGGPIFREGH